MSYLTPAEAQSLLDTIGQNQFLSDDAVLVQCLFRASKIIDNLYGHLYPGVVLTSDQELLWPRTVCYDINGQKIAQGTIPKQLKYATAILAQGVLHNKDLSETNQIKLERTKVGPIETEIEYKSTLQQAKSQTIADVESWLAPLIGLVNSSARVIKVII